MNKIKNYIPIYCELGGVEFNTIITKELQNNGNLGKSAETNSIIQIQDINCGIEVSKTQQQNTYFHELSHMIFAMIGEHELSGNEKLVQNVGNMIFEFLRTVKWETIENIKNKVSSENNIEIPFIDPNAIIEIK